MFTRQNIEQVCRVPLVLLVIAWLVGILLESVLLYSLGMLLLMAGIVILLIVVFGRGRWLVLCLLPCMFLGMLRYAVAMPSNDPYSVAAYIGRDNLKVRGTVSDVPVLRGSRRTLTIAVNKVALSGKSPWREAHGEIVVQTRGIALEETYGANYGDALELTGKLDPPFPGRSPAIVAKMEFPRITVYGSGENPILVFWHDVRIELARRLTRLLPQPEAALLVAILLNLRTPTLRPLMESFNMTGTTHLMAASGFNVTIVAGLVGRVVSWLPWSAKGRSQKEDEQQVSRGQRRLQLWSKTLLVILCVSMYTLLCGMEPAILRAAVMGVVMAVAPCLDRSYNVYASLALTALLMSMIDPFLLWDLSFQLSFLGTLGIVLFTSFFQRRLCFLERLPGGHYLVEMNAVTLAAILATLPIFVVTFGQLSLISPLANLLTAPLLSGLLLLGALAGGSTLLPLPYDLAGGLSLLWAWAAWPLLWFMSHIVQWCAALPGAYIAVGEIEGWIAWVYYALLAFILVVLQEKHAVPGPAPPETYPLFPHVSQQTWRLIRTGAVLWIVIASCLSIVLPGAQTQLAITFLSVGPQGQPAQGQAILIRTPDGKHILIDGGLDAVSLALELDQRLPVWPRKLDVVILTTPAPDHLDGLLDVVDRYEIGIVRDGGMRHPNTTYALWRRKITENNFQYKPVGSMERMMVGAEVSLQVVWPQLPLSKDTRDNGIALHMTSPGLRALFLGITAQSSSALTGMLNELDADELQADIVQLVGKVDQPFPEELKALLQKVQPSLLIITPALVDREQRKDVNGSVLKPSALFSLNEGRWQVVQTAQQGTVEIQSSVSG